MVGGDSGTAKVVGAVDVDVDGADMALSGKGTVVAGWAWGLVVSD